MYFVFLLILLFFIGSLEYQFKGGTIRNFYQKNTSEKNATLYCLIFCVMYTLILSSQYGVGTDYFTYSKIFMDSREADLYRRKNENFFYFISIFLQKNKLYPQIGFLIISILQFTFIYNFLKKQKIESYTLFFLVYLSYGTFTYNQTNGLRSYLAATILLSTYYYVFTCKYIKAFLFVLIASQFHSSALLIIPFIFIFMFFKRKFSSKMIILVLVLALVLSTFDLMSLFFNYIPLLSRYSHYMEEGGYGLRSIGMVNKMLKYVYIPFYLLSIKSYEKRKDPMEIFLFNMGFFAFSYRLFALSSPLFNRFSAYFEFFIVYPIYYLLYDLVMYKLRYRFLQQMIILFIFALMIGLFLIKSTVMASAEYDYHSIYPILINYDNIYSIF